MAQNETMFQTESEKQTQTGSVIIILDGFRILIFNTRKKFIINKMKNRLLVVGDLNNF